MELLRPGDLAAHRDTIVERRVRLHLGPMAGGADLARPDFERAVDARVAAGDAELLEVRGGGYVWLTSGALGELDVVDLLIADPAQAPAVRREVLALASERGAAQVSVHRYPGDPSSTAFADDPAFTVSSSSLLLDLSGSSPRAGARLEPMDDAGFAAFVEATSRDYAEEEVAAGAAGTRDERIAAAREELDELLPAGRRTAGHHLWSVVTDDGPVGRLWSCERTPRAGFVYDVVVDEAHRGQGLGRATMDAAAAWCREQGLAVLGLNVFGPNTVARGLYDTLGYRVVMDYLVTAAR